MATRPTVLVVDDDPDVRELIREHWLGDQVALAPVLQ